MYINFISYDWPYKYSNENDLIESGFRCRVFQQFQSQIFNNTVIITRLIVAVK